MGKTVSKDHLLSPNKDSTTGTGLRTIQLLAKGSHGNPQTTRPVAKANQQQGAIAEDNSTQFIDHGLVQVGAYIKIFTPMF